MMIPQSAEAHELTAPSTLREVVNAGDQDAWDSADGLDVLVRFEPPILRMVVSER